MKDLDTDTKYLTLEQLMNALNHEIVQGEEYKNLLYDLIWLISEHKPDEEFYTEYLGEIHSRMWDLNPDWLLEVI